MPVRQDQETAVIGEQFQPIILMAKIPPDPSVPRRALESGSGKTQKSDPLISEGCDIPEGFADLGKRTEVMMLLH